MRLDHIGIAQALVRDRHDLMQRLEAANAGRITVGMNGFFLDDTFVSIAAPVVAAEYQRRLNHVEQQLVALGVELD